MSYSEIEKIEKKYHLERVREYKDYKYLPKNTFVLKVTKESNGNPIRIANKLLTNEKRVLDADPNLINRHDRRSPQPDEETEEEAGDGFFRDQWYLNAFDDPAGGIKEGAGIYADGAWQMLKEKKGLDGGDAEIVVAIIDFSFRVIHEALKDKLVEGYKAFDFVKRDENTAFQVPMDHHGTRCAGVVLANEPGSDIRGIAYGCSFLPVKIPESRDDKLLIEIAEKVGERADIISCSLMPEPDDSPPLHPLLFTAFKNISETGGRRNKGCVLCFAVGNYNLPVNENINPGLQWCFAGEPQDPYTGEIFNPYAAHPNVIAVSASTSIVEKAPYSSFGKEISLCAPSDNYGACDKRIVVNRTGPGIWTTDLRSYTDRFGGTSCAAPLVAGVAALVLSANPMLSAIEVRKILEETADQINLQEMEITNSPGRYKTKASRNLSGRKHSIWFGYGKVNASKAVEQAFNLLND